MSLFNLITTITLIVELVLIVVVLIQEPKDSLISYNSDASSIQQVGSTQKVSSLEKLTWILIGTLFVLVMLASVCLKHRSPVQLSPNLIQSKAYQSQSREGHSDGSEKATDDGEKSSGAK